MMKSHHFLTRILGLAMLFHAGLVSSQDLEASITSSSALTINGEIIDIDAPNNQIVLGDQVYRLKDIVQINGEQRLAEQAYRNLSDGTQVSITVNHQDDQGYPVISAIRTQKSP